jgi:hypothetical protein
MVEWIEIQYIGAFPFTPRGVSGFLSLFDRRKICTITTEAREVPGLLETVQYSLRPNGVHWCNDCFPAFYFLAFLVLSKPSRTVFAMSSALLC